MEKNKIIIIALIVIIVALLAAIIAVTSNFNKADSKLEIMGNDALNEGDNLQIKLTDANGTALANQNVTVTITDSKKTSDYHSVVTDAEGIGELKLDKAEGEYDVTVSYGGNDKYDHSNATKKITVKKNAAQTQSSSASDFNGPDVDSRGTTRQQAEANNMRYMEVTIDGENVGVYVRYDPNTGSYHM